MPEVEVWNRYVRPAASGDAARRVSNAADRRFIGISFLESRNDRKCLICIEVLRARSPGDRAIIPAFSAPQIRIITTRRSPLRPLQTTRLLLLISAALIAVSGVAFGSGFSIFEQGSKATGMGGAFAATADDPSAIFYNVAGIAQQRKMAILGGGTGISFTNEFRGDPNDPYTVGTRAEYKRHLFVPPNGYAIVPIGKNLTFGVGVFTPFGLRTDWANPNTYLGRFISQDANLKTLSIEPAVAWQTDDGRLAIGLGAEYRRSHVILARNNGIVNPFTQRISDVAHVGLDSGFDNAAWGYNVGILLKPNSSWRFGLSYRGDMKINYKGTAVFTQIPTGNAELDAVVKAGLPPNQPITTQINFPATLIGGIAYTGFTNWTIETDITHTTWSKFQNLDIIFTQTPANNLHRPQNWKDTFSYRLGVNRTLGQNWDARIGGVYDKNPQPTEGVGPLLPDSDREGVAFGLGWHSGPFLIDVTEFALHFKNRSTQGINLDHFNGTYKTDANLITIDFGYKF
ncbi:MAG TPA: outer membrane protein transport protein [Thermoanaerobaculia bacterium]|nr:outer membrane protein transport protein [Thermoanaerobaculia bacterium]